MANVVEVRTPARLHLGMMSFGVPEARAFGGVGVMIDRPGVQVRLRRAERFEARGVHGERALRTVCEDRAGPGGAGWRSIYLSSERSANAEALRGAVLLGR